jgi:hypothetical protein
MVRDFYAFPTDMIKVSLYQIFRIITVMYCLIIATWHVLVNQILMYTECRLTLAVIIRRIQIQPEGPMQII